MIRGLVQILIFQGLGEIISKLLGLPVPGPVIGLILLLVFLLLRGRIDPDLDLVASGFAQHLGVLFIPAAVGVVMFAPQLASHGLVIALILIISVSLAVAVTSLLLKWLTRKDRAPGEEVREYLPKRKAGS
jgi:holin-like protein